VATTAQFAPRGYPPVPNWQRRCIGWVSFSSFWSCLHFTSKNRFRDKFLIEATDQQGRKWILMPRLGSILGDSDDQSVIPVAEALLHLMETTKPADFETVVYDDDTNNTATYGCKDGKCYWHEVSGNQLP